VKPPFAVRVSFLVLFVAVLAAAAATYQGETFVSSENNERERRR